ncbi:MAG: hypothetical protein ACM3NF_06485 [Gemmatimonadota bacterium]
MKRAISLAVVLVLFVVLAPVVGRALWVGGADAHSETRKFTIDGKAFRVSDPAVDGLSQLQGELERRGIDALPGSTDPLSLLDSRCPEALAEEPAEKAPAPLPRGLEADHAIRMETGTGPVEIVVGRLVGTNQDVLGRLRSSGWECRESGAPGAIAHFTKGREASFVVLEENGRRFLAIRRPAR